MAKTGNTGIRRIVYAAKYSMQGFGAAWKHEAAFRQELMLTAVLTAVAAILPSLDILERFLLMVFPWLVMTVEILNSAIEAVVDRFGDEWNELSGRAKDLGSAAVFVMLMLTLADWIVILIRNYCLISG
ncbi:MAG: diacylglycerol kinase [Succinivibrionaceae bacterium]|nr:diacylglycerol kinase [Succinivibrionaceae bacterium]